MFCLVLCIQFSPPLFFLTQVCKLRTLGCVLVSPQWHQISVLWKLQSLKSGHATVEYQGSGEGRQPRRGNDPLCSLKTKHRADKQKTNSSNPNKTSSWSPFWNFELQLMKLFLFQKQSLSQRSSDLDRGTVWKSFYSDLKIKTTNKILFKLSDVRCEPRHLSTHSDQILCVCLFTIFDLKWDYQYQDKQVMVLMGKRVFILGNMTFSVQRCHCNNKWSS